jgi:cytochrome c553
MQRGWLWLLPLTPLLAGAAPPAARKPRPLTAAEAAFERHVRPVLLARCAGCHGPKKRMGGLRLDTRAGLRQGGDNGPVIQPGNPGASRLIQAVRQAGALKMPPEGKLPPDAVVALEAWVRAGAAWPEEASPVPVGGRSRHWAFRPVRRPAAPRARGLGARTAIDAFLLAGLQEKGLSFAPEAGRRTLIRRLSFDLVGLPPAPEEVEAFVADGRPDAYERLVERYLASPRHGERWARYWLDVARYADTKGYVFFEEANYPWGYTYRDYLIEAFNEDRPYDRMVLEQLAADQLDLGQDRRPLRAMGLLTLGGRFMNNVHDVIDDRIDVVTRGLMGLTVSCARCHDHKFDPIPSADYYALYGVFASSVEPAVPPLFADPPNTPVYEKFTKELAKRERALAEYVRGKHAEVRKGARVRAGEYLLAAHARRGQPPADDFMLIADGNDLNPAMLSRWQAYLERAGRKHHRVFAAWHAFAALPEKEFAAGARELARQIGAGRLAGRPINPLVARAFAAATPTSMKGVAAVYGELLRWTEGTWQDALATAEHDHRPPPRRLRQAGREELRQVLYGPDAAAEVPPNLFDDLALLPDRPSQAELQKRRRELEQWRATGAGAPPRAMVLVDTATPYLPRVFRRGNPNNPGPAVPRQFLEVVAGAGRKPFSKGSGRLELARAIASADNPLTARVLVNRLWQHHFGQGLVRTPGDFGTRGEVPTHPELLDWLAAEFVHSGWSMKHLHRLILLSAAYRQSSGMGNGEWGIGNEDKAEGKGSGSSSSSPHSAFPIPHWGDALLARFPRRRLDFEATRDALLAVSGSLDSTIGGPSVQGIFSPGSRKRTLYGWVDRLHVPGLYRTFDFPSPDASSADRDRTTVAPQALFFLNNPFVLSSARGLLNRPEVHGEKELGRRVDRLHRLCFGRAAGVEERALARQFLGASSTTAWERYAQALLLTNEFVFVD